ncbi:hypothetical protein ACPPVU_21970 [Mucilaginibacter sp. McL0603]|uniref:hypothetical protein n=1 Tax=Mucilaginibacter sp. McL0603 TaxID=3415670 RepID=UPI003CF5D020
MLRHLFVFVIFSLFLTSAFAQTQTDSVNSHPTVDTVVKHSPTDSAVKNSKINTKVKHPHAGRISKQSTVDSVIKHPLVDSSAKQPPVKKAAKLPAVNTVVIKHSPIKTLSDERYNILLNGSDFDDMALVGAMNHYPLPDEALKYKVQIGLNPGQITKLKDIAEELHRKKVEMGQNIIKNEKMLDSLFHSKRVIDGTIIFYSNRYGLYLGEIRNAVLQACYKTENILSDDQIKRLEAARKGH